MPKRELSPPVWEEWEIREIKRCLREYHDCSDKEIEKIIREHYSDRRELMKND